MWRNETINYHPLSSSSLCLHSILSPASSLSVFFFLTVSPFISSQCFPVTCPLSLYLSLSSLCFTAACLQSGPWKKGNMSFRPWGIVHAYLWDTQGGKKITARHNPDVTPLLWVAVKNWQSQQKKAAQCPEESTTALSHWGGQLHALFSHP